MNKELLMERLAELPLYIYDFIDPKELEFNGRIRWICEHECPMYGTSWACPPGVGSVDSCKGKCLSYKNCLLISSIVEVGDITNIEETLATRPDHEELTNQVGDLLREQGIKIRDVDPKEFHLLVTANVNAVFQAVEHDFTREEALRYATTLDRFFSKGWQELFGY